MAALLNVATAMGLWLAVTTGICLYLCPLEGGAFFANLIVPALLFFNNLNIFISFCEIALGRHIMLIKEDYKKLKQKYGGGKEFEGCIAFLTMRLTVSQAFDSKTWSKMWSTYALYDPSYQNHEAFGFFIDVGNGWSTIPPSLLMNAAMVFPHRISPLLAGCIGIASYWQIMYGTYIYFLSFVFNRRYEGFPKGEIWGFVGISNSIWIVFPAMGIYACVCMLRDGNMSVFGV